jgi:hypothetical protein
MMGDENNKVVSLTEHRERLRRQTEEQLLQKTMLDMSSAEGFSFDDPMVYMLGIGVFGSNNPTAPIDVIVTATDSDNKYNLAKLFDFSPDESRLLALAEGLEKLAAVVRQVYGEMPVPPHGPNR